MRLAKSVHPSLAGLQALVIGRSNIVGKPLAQLLLAESATVTIAHSKTRDLPAVSRSADLVFAAVGRPEMVRGDWIRPGATVIDVGINRVMREGKLRLVGDIAFAEVREVARRRHAGSGGCRADDDRLPARQHGHGRLRDCRTAGSRTVTERPGASRRRVNRARAQQASERRICAGTIRRDCQLPRMGQFYR